MDSNNKVIFHASYNTLHVSKTSLVNSNIWKIFLNIAVELFQYYFVNNCDKCRYAMRRVIHEYRAVIDQNSYSMWTVSGKLRPFELLTESIWNQTWEFVKPSSA